MTDFERVIEEITQLVFQQLSGDTPETPAAVAIPEEPKAQVLFAMGEGRRGAEAIPALARFAGNARIVAVPSSSWPAARLQSVLPGARVLDRPPGHWDELVKGSRAVVIPNLSVNALAGIALLAGLEPCAAAAVQGLIEGKPVLAGGEDVNFLTLNAAHLSKPLQDILRGHIATVQGLGVRLVEMKVLGEEIERCLQNRTPAAGIGRGRNVLTRDDVDTLLRGGHRVIEVAVGTIVTELARDAARDAGVEIVMR